MYNLLLSTALSLLVAAVVLLSGFPWVSAIIPAILVWPVAAFVLSRRTGRQVTQAMAPLAGLMQAGKVEEAKRLLHDIDATYGRWQPMLHGQIAAQLGMFDYLQMKFDEALPQLEKGTFRDWSANTAIACIHWRKGDLDAADAAFAKAAGVGGKELTVYVVWAWAMSRKNERARALAAVSAGLEALPDHALLRHLKNTLANKKPIDPKKLPETVFNFFPEDLAQQAMMRGRRGPGPLEGKLPPGARQRVQQGPPAPRMRGKMARRR